MNPGQTASQYLIDASPYVGTLVLALVGFLATHAAAWLRAHTKNALANGFATRLATEVYAGVQAMEQTVVADLKARSGAKLTAADAAKVKADAVNLILTNLGGDKWIAEAKKVIGETDVKEYLASRVEAAVHELQSYSPPLPPPPAVTSPAAA